MINALLVKVAAVDQAPHQQLVVDVAVKDFKLLDKDLL